MELNYENIGTQTIEWQNERTWESQRCGCTTNVHSITDSKDILSCCCLSIVHKDLPWAWFSLHGNSLKIERPRCCLPARSKQHSVPFSLLVYRSKTYHLGSSAQPCIKVLNIIHVVHVKSDKYDRFWRVRHHPSTCDIIQIWRVLVPHSFFPPLCSMTPSVSPPPLSPPSSARTGSSPWRHVSPGYVTPGQLAPMGKKEVGTREQSCYSHDTQSCDIS